MFRFFSSRTRSLIYSTSCYRDRFGSPFETIDLFKKIAEEGKLGMRLWVMIRDSNELLQEKLPEYKIIGMADNHLTVRAKDIMTVPDDEILNAEVVYTTVGRKVMHKK